ncbi:hypothetical protein CDL15_Pgr021876 [Punica granatum]|uniref:Uncharacterized protein n=1 Tax=Punica granatum TaxID=22663 RepID=A0A218WU14_PUNGR|nr:hypothetical protein CDL15_Pgr021876 [Punica granatum]
MPLPHKYLLLPLPPATTGAAPRPPTLTFRQETPVQELRRVQQAPPSCMLSSCRGRKITCVPRALPSALFHRLKFAIVVRYGGAWPVPKVVS